jgi:hypothetical protein
MITEVNRAMSLLKETPKECNWKGYVQQNATAVIRCKEMLFAIANQEGVLKWWIDRQKQDHGRSDFDLIHTTHASWFGRMLDGGHDPLGRAYSRLCSIDDQNREWNQPYFALNPSEGVPVCVG